MRLHCRVPFSQEPAYHRSAGAQIEFYRKDRGDQHAKFGLSSVQTRRTPQASIDNDEVDALKSRFLQQFFPIDVDTIEPAQLRELRSDQAKARSYFFEWQTRLVRPSPRLFFGFFAGCQHLGNFLFRWLLEQLDKIVLQSL